MLTAKLSALIPNPRSLIPSMKIVVTGAYGQLGGELCRQLGTDAIPLDIDTLDLTDGPAVVDRMLAVEARGDHQLRRLHAGR